MLTIVKIYRKNKKTLRRVWKEENDHSEFVGGATEKGQQMAGGKTWSSTVETITRGTTRITGHNTDHGARHGPVPSRAPHSQSHGTIFSPNCVLIMVLSRKKKIPTAMLQPAYGQVSQIKGSAQLYSDIFMTNCFWIMTFFKKIVPSF